MGKKKGFLKIDVKKAEEKHAEEEKKTSDNQCEQDGEMNNYVFSQINDLIFISGKHIGDHRL